MLNRWLFTLDSRPPLNIPTSFSKLGVKDDDEPLTFTQHGDLCPICSEDIALYNLPAEAHGHIGQFIHYQTLGKPCRPSASIASARGHTTCYER